MNNKKALFFDIDGTLLTSYPFRVPESARQALQEARANGHKLFINSGRTFAILPSIIKEMGFDGFVCGCGSQIYMDGELVHASTIPHDLCVETVKMARECEVPGVFECPDRLLYDGSGKVLTEFLDRLNKLTTVADLTTFSEEETAAYTFDKFLMIARPNCNFKKFRAFCDEHFSCFEHTDGACEFTQKNYSKATGIQFILDRLNLSLEDSYAFGDSNNDLPMLKYAGNSIAMGNCNPDILPYCTYQTTDIEEDGIKNALKHFGLI